MHPLTTRLKEVTAKRESLFKSEEAAHKETKALLEAEIAAHSATKEERDDAEDAAKAGGAATWEVASVTKGLATCRLLFCVAAVDPLGLNLYAVEK
jgi:hypothetical protein